MKVKKLKWHLKTHLSLALCIVESILQLEVEREKIPLELKIAPIMMRLRLNMISSLQSELVIKLLPVIHSSRLNLTRWCKRVSIMIVFSHKKVMNSMLTSRKSSSLKKLYLMPLEKKTINNQKKIRGFLIMTILVQQTMNSRKRHKRWSLKRINTQRPLLQRNQMNPIQSLKWPKANTLKSPLTRPSKSKKSQISTSHRVTLMIFKQSQGPTPLNWQANI